MHRAGLAARLGVPGFRSPRLTSPPMASGPEGPGFAASAAEAGPGGRPAPVLPPPLLSRCRRGNRGSTCRDVGKVGFGRLLAVLQTVLRPHLPVHPQGG